MQEMDSKPELYKIYLSSKDHLKVRTFSNMLLDNCTIADVRKKHLVIEEVHNRAVPVHISRITEASKEYVNGIFRKDVGKENYLEFTLPKKMTLIKYPHFNHIFLPSIQSVISITSARGIGDA